jgi:hypothetical protein
VAGADQADIRDLWAQTSIRAVGDRDPPSPRPMYSASRLKNYEIPGRLFPFGFGFLFLGPELQAFLPSSPFAVQFLFSFDPLVLPHSVSPIVRKFNTIGCPSRPDDIHKMDRGHPV